MKNDSRNDQECRQRKSRSPEVDGQSAGFTLTELLCILFVLALCSLVVLPALARSGPTGWSFRCLNNLRQLKVAWQAYAEDFNYTLVAAQSGLSARPNWMVGILGTSDPVNWDPNLSIVLSPLWPYVRNDTNLFRCPGDLYSASVGGVWRLRVRTYSMSQVFGTGEWLDKVGSQYQTAWRTYTNLNEIVLPSKTFVFAEEHQGSINDAAFANACTGAQPTNAPADAVIVDWPAGHHNGAGAFSFADGRAELHSWIGSTLKTGYGFTDSMSTTPAGDSWVDMQWLAENTTVRK